MCDKDVWDMYIGKLNMWHTYYGECSLRYNGTFKNGSPVYLVTQISDYPTLDEFNLYSFVVYRDLDGLWKEHDVESDKYVSVFGSGGVRYPNPETIRYVVDNMDERCYKEGFEKVEKLLSYPNLKTIEKDYREVIYYVLLCIQRYIHFPIEMIVHIMSFMRVCENEFLKKKLSLKND